MKHLLIYLLTLGFLITLPISCVTKKKKSETSKLGKAYHNTTAYYNGYWNSKEILKESMVRLKESNVDNYNNILEVEDFVSVDNPKMVKPEMDKIIDKVTTVAQLHEPSDWVDDCYVMMAKAQYLKQEYETAEETLVYFQEDFNPSNPYGRNYKSKKLTGEAAKRKREEEKKAKDEAREKEREEKEDLKKQKAKEKEELKEARDKKREEDKKARDKKRKEDAKRRKSGKSKPKSKSKTVVPTALDSLDNKKLETTTKKNVSQPLAAQEKKEEDVYVPPTPKKPEEDKTAYSEGLLWLAKVYIKRENWFASEMLLKKLETGFISDRIKSDLPATFANLYIKQKRYSEAILFLEKAIENEDDKQLKARYSFIAGQLSQLVKNNAQALDHFANAKKYAKDIKMEFMADMAVAKNGLLTGEFTKLEVIERLQKMLNEDKNISLKDQIYYTLAEIELSQDNYVKAIEYFKSSLASNSADQKLKTEAYYSIANQYYIKENYLEASNYFDSTSTLMASTDSRSDIVKKYVVNLKEIAANISTILKQDSLLYFASLTEEEQKAQIPGYLSRNKKATSDTQELPTVLLSKQLNISNSIDFGNSNFFAYNKVNKIKGKQEFNAVWGTRPLEDDWRRVNKAFSGGKIEVAETKTNESNGKEVNMDTEEYDNFVKSLPSNPIQKQDANTKITDAMFSLGKLFRDKIENFSKSAETLETMHTRFGPTPYELDSYYYLYLDYVDLNKMDLASNYKNKIVRKYPDSKYTAILNDPDFFNKNNRNIDKSEAFYQLVYDLFSKGEYLNTLNAIDNSNQVGVENNPYLAKIALIRAMCVGHKDGKEEYIKALSSVIISYPNTPEQSKAKEIMRFLGGDNNAFNSLDVNDVDKIYQKDDASIHYVAIVTYDLDETKRINAKVSISEFNKKNFKLDRLQFGDGVLSIPENVQVILVRMFDNVEKAMEYYKKANENKEEFIGPDQINYDILPITQANYRKMISLRSSSAYRLFFETNYLNDR